MFFSCGLPYWGYLKSNKDVAFCGSVMMPSPPVAVPALFPTLVTGVPWACDFSTIKLFAQIKGEDTRDGRHSLTLSTLFFLFSHAFFFAPSLSSVGVLGAPHTHSPGVFACPKSNDEPNPHNCKRGARTHTNTHTLVLLTSTPHHTQIDAYPHSIGVSCMANFAC